MPKQRPTQPVFRQLPLALPDIPDQLLPADWPSWSTKITTTPAAPAHTDAGDRKKATKPRRKK